MDDIDELDPNEALRNIQVHAVDAYDNYLPSTLNEWDKLTKKFEEQRKQLRRIIEDYDNGRLGFDDGNTAPVIPMPPKPPLNLGGYRKLEDE